MQETIIGSNQAGQRFDKYLHKYLPQAGTGFIYKMLRKKNITLNGKKAEGKEILQIGDKVQCFFSDETFRKLNNHDHADCDKEYGNIEYSLISEAYEKAYRTISARIIFENNHILIADKPCGVLSQKAKSTDISLNEWLIGYLLCSKQITCEELKTFKPSVCNRLDRNTSGIVLCGKTLSGSRELSRLIHERSIQKFYQTICFGFLSERQKLQGYLWKDEKTNTVKIECKQSLDSDYICTIYEPIKLLGKTKETAYTLLEVELVTGKPHQIRAHLASIGHSIIGDAKYGTKTKNQAVWKQFGLKHQLLHATRVVFHNCGEPLADLEGKEFVAPLPKQFSKILKELP